MIEKFSLEAQRVLTLAETIAFDMDDTCIREVHLLLAIIKDDDNSCAEVLGKYKISFEDLYSLIKIKKDKKGESKDNCFFLDYTNSYKNILDKSVKLSRDLKEPAVSLFCLSYHLFQTSNKELIKTIEYFKVDTSYIISRLSRHLSRRSELDNITDLTDLSTVKHDPLIGRELELDLLVRTLKRRNKPNAILLGEPGVGKTSLVEELSQRIKCNEIEGLENKRIYELDMSSVVGGTKYRGEFEEKMKKIIKKVIEDKDAILFVDEIHSIVKAGGAEGAIDASNILKPYLSRGEIQIIGATTNDEYYNSIAKDKALNRRFQIIRLKDSSSEESFNILKANKGLYEDYYKIEISDVILKYIVDVATKYLPEKHFPDKAIDILDNSCSYGNQELKMDDIHKAMESLYNIFIGHKDLAIKAKEYLENSLVGQDRAIEQIYKNLRIHTNKIINNINKPTVLMFYGPSGVGKTEASKIIGKEYQYATDNFLRIDASIFHESNSLYKLIGYYNEYGYNGSKTSFMKKITNYPSLCVLLDDFDKASEDVVDFFTGIFEDGSFLDNNGEKVDCSHMLFLLTTSYGCNSHRMYSVNGIVKTSNEMVVDAKVLTKRFKDSLLNRLDDIIVFKYLDDLSQREMSRRIVKEILRRKGLTMDFEIANDISFVEEKVYQEGSRYINRTVLAYFSQIEEEKEKPAIKQN